MNAAMIDPGLHLQCLNDHGIFTIDELNLLSKVVKPNLSVLHLNVRSFNKSFDELKNIFDSLPFSFDFLGCSETFINSLDLDRVEILEYHLITDNRTFSCGGGVVLYVKRDQTFKVRDDLKLPDIENIWIESTSLAIAVICKPPKFPNQAFLDKLKEIVHKICLSKRRCLIMRDMNINTFSRSKMSKDYLNSIRSEGFNPHIFEGTHITEITQRSIFIRILLRFPQVAVSQWKLQTICLCFQLCISSSYTSFS